MEIFYNRRATQSRISPPQLLRHVGMLLGESFDVQLVNDCLVPGNARQAIVAPVKLRLDHLGKRRDCCRIASRIEHQRVPCQAARNYPGIGFKKDLAWIEAMTQRRILRSVNPIAIELSRSQARRESMPDVVCPFRKLNSTSFRFGLR